MRKNNTAVLLKDWVLIAAAEEERFSRKKHYSSFPHLAISFCLRKAKITARELDDVVFYEKPFSTFERIFLNAIAFAPRSMAFFKESMKGF